MWQSLARLKQNRLAQILLAATLLFACAVCLVLGGAGALLALQGSPTATAASKLVSPTPARPVPSPAVTPTGPTPEDSKADPTAPAAAEEPVEELSDAAKTSYLSQLFLEGTTVMLE